MAIASIVNILKFFVYPVLKDIAVGTNLPTTQYALIWIWWKMVEGKIWKFICENRGFYLIEMYFFFFWESLYCKSYITYRSEENDLKRSQEEQVEVSTTKETQVANHALIFLLALKTNKFFLFKKVMLLHERMKEFH